SSFTCPCSLHRRGAVGNGVVLGGPGPAAEPAGTAVITLTIPATARSRCQYPFHQAPAGMHMARPAGRRPRPRPIDPFTKRLVDRLLWTVQAAWVDVRSVLIGERPTSRRSAGSGSPFLRRHGAPAGAWRLTRGCRAKGEPACRADAPY